VAGACFCCNFNELLKTVGSLEASDQPDVILAEPVGSCTDLVATVVQPLMQLYGGEFDVAPYGVIFKPSHGRRILRDEPGSGFSHKAAYIFRKQLEEADFILLNRIDELNPAEVDELSALLTEQYPGLPQLRVSAKTGQGFDALVELLDQRGPFGRRVLELDYDVYAEGEAELGWLNSSLTVSGGAEFPLDELLLGTTERLQAALAEAGAVTAHLKVIGLWEGFYGVANLVSNDGKAELSLPSNCRVRQADLVVNARVAIDPQDLERHVHAAVEAMCHEMSLAATWRETRSFRPGRPVPTHRLQAKV
jgi:hypothetical protein